MAQLRIAFVDDEPNILNGLRRMLRSQRQEWEMSFFGSGTDVLAAMEENPFDIVVSDMRMPEMDGAELLRLIHERNPATGRIILSGYSDQALILKTVGFAHQFLAKPCSAETLKAVINRSMRLRGLLGNEALQKQVSRIKALPTPPKIFQRLLTEIDSDQSSFGSIAKIIGADAGLSSKILQLVNSAFFGLPTPVASLTQAIQLIGMDTIRSLVITSGIFRQHQVPTVGRFTAAWHMDHGLAVGGLAMAVAKHLGLDQESMENAMLVGLLHDIGMFIEINFFEEEFRRAHAIGQERGIPLYEAEVEVFGTSHSEIGAYLLGLWGLPDPIVEAVSFHHNPGEVGESEPGILCALHIANNIRDAVDSDRSFMSWEDLFDVDYIRSMGLADGMDQRLQDLWDLAGELEVSG
jgi:putative nucleotidyltransferase with HDIG domain